jgi:hypothetical protein
MTRDEHLEWCKKRALEYIDRGDGLNGLTSMLSDLRKHDETKDHPGIPVCVQLMMFGASEDVTQARRLIDGFR